MATIEYGRLREAVLGIIPEDDLVRAVQRAESILGEAVGSDWWGQIYWLLYKPAKEPGDPPVIVSRWHLALMAVPVAQGQAEELVRGSIVLSGEVEESKAQIHIWRTPEGNWRATGIFGPHVE